MREKQRFFGRSGRAVDVGVHPGRNPGRVQPGRARPPDDAHLCADINC